MTTDAPPPALGELARLATQLRAFAREHLHGGCKVLSLGDDCRCNLCAVDDLVALASGGAAMREAMTAAADELENDPKTRTCYNVAAALRDALTPERPADAI